MTPKDFAAAWGEQHLVVFSMDALTSVNIPMSSKRFLAEGGRARPAPPFLATATAYISCRPRPRLRCCPAGMSSG